MSKVRRYQRARLQSYVDAAALAKQLAAYSAATGVTASAVVQAALRQYLDKTSDATLIMRRLDRLGRAGARTQRDLELQMEAFALWVKIWFAPHAPHSRRRKGLRPPNGREPLRPIPAAPGRAVPGRSPVPRRSAPRSSRG